MRTILLLGLLILSLGSCHKGHQPSGEELPQYDDQSAELVLNVVSRGSYEYLVVVADQEYLPTELAEEMKTRCREQQGRLAVRISGAVLPEMDWVHRPGPTDVPERDREVHRIDLTKIEMRY